MAVGLALVVAGWLAFQIVLTGYARAYAHERPEAVLEWRPNNAVALGASAEEMLIGARSAGKLQAATALARRGLAASPLNLPSLKTLGFAAIMTGREDQAEALLEMAAQRSLRDSPAHLWLFRRRMSERDWSEAFRHADILMRKPPRGFPVAALVASAVDQPGAAEALVEHMRDGPPWREWMIQRLARISPPLAFDILLKLDKAGSPGSDREIGSVLSEMVRADAIPQAYLVWVQLLPPEGLAKLADVYDSGFDGLPGAPPFNWDLNVSGASGAEVDTAIGGGQALYVRFGGSKPQTLARQLLLLPPGRYRLVMRGYTEEPGRGDQLRWTLACHGARGAPLAELPAPDDALAWRRASAVARVPETGCLSQSLVLTGYLGARSDTMRAWFDDVAIQRRF